MGVGQTARSAHACTCGSPYVDLALASVDGDGALTDEQAFWPLELALYDDLVDGLTSNYMDTYTGEISITMEKVQ